MRRWLYGFLFSALCFILVLGTGCLLRPLSETGPPPLFGVQTFEINDATVRARAMEAGIRWVRLAVRWEDIEPYAPADPRHTHNWSSLDTMFANANSVGLIPHSIVGNSPEWAVEDVSRAQGQYYDCGPIDPDDLDAFAAFVTALVERYDGDGVDDAPGSPLARYWEFWNEPDNQSTLPGCIFVGGCWGGDLDNDGIPDPEEYAIMLSYAHPAVKVADPNAKVVFGGVAYESISQGCFNINFTDQVLTRLETLSPNGSAGDYFDLMNFHYYDFRRDKDGQSPYNQGMLGKALGPGGPSGPSIRGILTNHGLGDMPMVVSEIGLGSDLSSIGEELKARYLVREFVRAMSVWPGDIKAVIWFEMVDDRTSNNKGLLDANDLTPYPAYYAYRTLISELAGYEFVRQMTLEEVGSNDRIQGYIFSKEGVTSNKLVLWRDEWKKPIKKQSMTATETMDVSATQLGTWTGRLSVVNKFGDEMIMGNDGADSITITFSSDPVYVEASP